MPWGNDGEDVSIYIVKLVFGLPFVKVGMDNVSLGVAFRVVLLDKIYDLFVYFYNRGMVEVVEDNAQAKTDDQNLALGLRRYIPTDLALLLRVTADYLVAYLYILEVIGMVRNRLGIVYVCFVGSLLFLEINGSRVGMDLLSLTLELELATLFYYVPRVQVGIAQREVGLVIPGLNLNLGIELVLFGVANLNI